MRHQKNIEDLMDKVTSDLFVLLLDKELSMVEYLVVLETVKRTYYLLKPQRP